MSSAWENYGRARDSAGWTWDEAQASWGRAWWSSGGVARGFFIWLPLLYKPAAGAGTMRMLPVAFRRVVEEVRRIEAHVLPWL